MDWAREARWAGDPRPLGPGARTRAPPGIAKLFVAFGFCGKCIAGSPYEQPGPLPGLRCKDARLDLGILRGRFFNMAFYYMIL